MSGQRAAAEPYTTRFQTTVAAVDGTDVWLETSYFYAESGGQPADRGSINGIDVVDVRLVDGEPVHVLDEQPSFGVGTHVLCSIDWSFRMYCMRAHTASHLLFGAGRQLLDDLGYAGFDIGEEKVRVDLETTTEIGDDVVLDLDERLNRAVWESRPVSWESVPVAEAREREDVAFNEATEEGAFEKGHVRLVTVGGREDNGDANGSSDPWDVAACGGTHVRNTREVGPATVLGRSNPGEGVTRVEFAVGPRAIERRRLEKATCLETGSTLGTGVEDVPSEVKRLTEERDRLEAERDELERAFLERRIEVADTIERPDGRWRVLTVEGVDSTTVSELLRTDGGPSEDEKESVPASSLVAGTDGGTTYVVAATGGEPSAADVIDELTETYGGGGGGTDDLAQGGGFSATPEEIVAGFERVELGT